MIIVKLAGYPLVAHLFYYDEQGGTSISDRKTHLQVSYIYTF